MYNKNVIKYFTYFSPLQTDLIQKLQSIDGLAGNIFCQQNQAWNYTDSEIVREQSAVYQASQKVLLMEFLNATASTNWHIP